MTTQVSMTNKAYAAGDVTTLMRTVKTDAALEKGTILGRVTGADLKAYDPDKSDGSQNPVCVLMQSVDTTGKDVQAACGYAGTYVKKNMTGIDDAAELTLEGRAIYFV